MASFIDMKSSDVWTDSDITARTEGELSGLFSPGEQEILSRKILGAISGQLVLTSAENADIEAYKASAFRSQAMGVAARADMALLQQCLNYEAAERRLQLQPLKPSSEYPAMVSAIAATGATVEVKNPVFDRDKTERAAAAALIASSAKSVLDLVAERRPVIK